MPETSVLDNAFQHESLDLTRPTIRVIQILPGTGTLMCLMKQVEIKSEHTAVSYVWGNAEPSWVILINDKPFYIRQNLHDFLIQMRKRSVLEPLWVDALCIDQSNILERNHQVKQLGSIFRDAHTVISWLGQGDDRAVQFMQVAVAVSKEVAEQRAARLGTTRGTDTGLYYLSVHRHRFEVAEFFQAVLTFCNIEYFNRTWIVQEVFLATGIHTAIYGDISLDWVDLKLVILTCTNWTFTKSAGRELSKVLPFVQASIYQSNTADSSSIFTLITKFAKTKCSDPRDHVFALRMLWDNGKFPIEVDYSLSSLSLFLKLTSLLLTSGIRPMSSVITFLDLLQLKPDDFANGGELHGTEGSRPITLSATWSREIDMRELSEYRAKRLEAGEYRFSERTTAHDFHFCTCEHCILVQDLPETTVFREYVLRSHDHDPTTRLRMDEEIYLVEIIGSKTYFGIVEGDLQDSDEFLLITPACLNRASELPCVEEIDGRLAVSLSLRCLGELFSHLRPDEVEDGEGYLPDREGYWGIDCNKHDYIYDDSDAGGHHMDKGIPFEGDERWWWGRRKWRREMRHGLAVFQAMPAQGGVEFHPSWGGERVYRRARRLAPTTPAHHPGPW